MRSGLNWDVMRLDTQWRRLRGIPGQKIKRTWGNNCCFSLWYWRVWTFEKVTREPYNVLTDSNLVGPEFNAFTMRLFQEDISLHLSIVFPMCHGAKLIVWCVLGETENLISLLSYCFRGFQIDFFLHIKFGRTGSVSFWDQQIMVLLCTGLERISPPADIFVMFCSLSVFILISKLWPQSRHHVQLLLEH